MPDRSVLRPGKPSFGVGEVVYLLPSARKGFIEAVLVAGVRFEPSLSAYVYSAERQFRKSFGRFVARKDAAIGPVEVREENLATLCEALPIRLAVSARELADLRSRFDSLCGGTDAGHPVEPGRATRSGSSDFLPAPRFGFNEVAYLRETAETTGRLEGLRLDQSSWDVGAGQWSYQVVFKPRPERPLPVGDRGTMQHDKVVAYRESELCSICEALGLAVSFMERSVSNDEARLTSLCPEATA